MTSAVIAATIQAHLVGTSWCLAHDGTRGWARRLWAIERPDQYLGRSGGGGIGYAAGASIGAALALREQGRLVVDVQGDGDLLYTPGALWTAAKYEVPLLIVVDNNRSYLNSQEHAERIARQRDRATDRAGVGTEIREPDVGIADLARSFGVWAEGPLSTASDLDEALSRAVAVVRDGRPALLDVAVSR
jgi:thiamine pyrophosphate-dependent acetolactate synthase large subunit-like protein